MKRKKLKRGAKGAAYGRAATSIKPSKRARLTLYSWTHSPVALLHFEETFGDEMRIVSSYASRAALTKLRNDIDRHLAEMKR